MKDAASVTHRVPKFFSPDNLARPNLVTRVAGCEGRGDTLFTRNSSKMSFTKLEEIYCGIIIPYCIDCHKLPPLQRSLPLAGRHRFQKETIVSNLSI